MKKRFLKSWQLKIVALALAVMVWFTIQREANTEFAIIHNVRVEPIVASGWHITEVEPLRVSVEVRGDRQAVTTVTADHFQARPDLSAVNKEGDVEVSLNESSVLSPAKIYVLKVQPSLVRVRMKPSEQH